MVFTAPMSCRSHSINNINIIRIFAWDIEYCMQLVIGRAKRALCSSLTNTPMGATPKNGGSHGRRHTEAPPGHAKCRPGSRGRGGAAGGHGGSGHRGQRPLRAAPAALPDRGEPFRWPGHPRARRQGGASSSAPTSATTSSRTTPATA